MNLEELKIKKETLEKQVKKLNQEISDTEKQIEELKRPKRWKPSLNETYYYISGLGEVCVIKWSDGDDFDQDLYSLGNCSISIFRQKRKLKRQ